MARIGSVSIAVSKNQRVAHVSDISCWFICKISEILKWDFPSTIHFGDPPFVETTIWEIFENIINIWQAAVCSKTYAVACAKADALAINTTYPQGEPGDVDHVDVVLSPYGTICNHSANCCINFQNRVERGLDITQV